MYVHICTYIYIGQKGPADAGLLLHHCERTYTCGPETVWCGEELPELVRTERGTGIAKGNGERGGRGGKGREYGFTPECIDSTVAQFSLSPAPLFASFSDSSHFLALLFYPPPSLAFYLCCSVYR